MRALLAVVLLAQLQAPLDSDGDGVPDVADFCPFTLFGAVVDGQGCSVADRVPCEPPGGRWPSREDYIEAVSDTAQAYVDAGLISTEVRDALVERAGNSTCGLI